MIFSVKRNILAILAVAMTASQAGAEIVSSSASHYELKHEALSTLPPTAIWQRLQNPGSWWHPDHTYSGDSRNMSVELQAGGVWREDWDGKSVLHGTVLYLEPQKVLRLNAPFGPLQQMGVTTIWTINISAEGSGSMISFSETSGGSSHSGLDKIAPAVDFVKSEAIKRLANISNE